MGRFVLREGLRVVQFELSSGGCHKRFALDSPRLQPLLELAAKAGNMLVLGIGGLSLESSSPKVWLKPPRPSEDAHGHLPYADPYPA